MHCCLFYLSKKLEFVPVGSATTAVHRDSLVLASNAHAVARGIIASLLYLGVKSFPLPCTLFPKIWYAELCTTIAQ